MFEGFYKVRFQLGDAVGRSVMHAGNGKMLGGNSAFAHIGTYEKTADGIDIVIKTVRHNPDPNYRAMAGTDDATLIAKGWADGDLYRFKGELKELPGVPFQSLMTPITEDEVPIASGVGEAGIADGLYSVHLRLLDGVEGGLTGVMLLNQGRILGGDASFYYLGSYTAANGRWKGQILNQEHTPAKDDPVFGGHEVGIGFSGTYDGEQALLEATALAGKRSLRLTAALKLMHRARSLMGNRMEKVRMLSTLGLMGAMRGLSSAFEAASGIHVDADFAPTLALLKRLRAGEAADLVILTREGLDEMIGEGRVIAGTAADLARSYVGLAVPKGAPYPDIANEAALRQTLLAARSVAYSRLGASGVYFAQLIVRMGIAAEINAKATIVEQGFTAERLVSGEADLAVQQISELKQVDGIEVIGPVPHDLQTPSVFSAGRMTNAKQAEAADRLLRYLASPEVVPVLLRSGLEP